MCSLSLESWWGKHSIQVWVGMCCPSRNASNYIFGEFDEFSLSLSNSKYAKIIQISSIHMFSNTCLWIYQSNIFCGFTNIAIFGQPAAVIK